MNWNDVCVDDYEELMQYNGQDCFSDKAIEILFGVEDPQSLQVSNYMKYLSELQFVGNHIPRTPLMEHYTLNGRKYNVDLNVAGLTMGQFTDFENYKKQQPMSLRDVLSVVMIPDGHSYNDGYDMQQVKNDIGTMSVVEASNVFSFFATWCFKYVGTLNYFLKHRMKKETRLMPIMEKIQQLYQQMKEEQTLMDICRTY